MPNLEDFAPGVRFEYSGREYVVSEVRGGVVYVEGGGHASPRLFDQITILTPIKREPRGFAKFIRHIEGEPNVQSSNVPASSSSGNEQCEGDECVPQQRRTQRTPTAWLESVSLQRDRWVDDDWDRIFTECNGPDPASTMGVYRNEYRPSQFSVESFIGDQNCEQQEAVPPYSSSQRRGYRTADS